MTTEEPVTVDAPLHGPWGRIQAWLRTGPPGADLSAVVDDQGRAGWPGLSEGLPTGGILEAFHDLRTFGYDGADRDTGDWSVRWVAESARTELVQPTGEVGTELVQPTGEVGTPSTVCRIVLGLPGFTLPPAADVVGGPEERFETAQALEESLQRAWLAQRTGSVEGHPIPLSHVYGHGQHGEIHARALLEKVLPLTRPGDEHGLVLDLESWTTLAGWFGDAGSLEVWMRGSDLPSRRSDRAWCLVRTEWAASPTGGLYVRRCTRLGIAAGVGPPGAAGSVVVSRGERLRWGGARRRRGGTRSRVATPEPAPWRSHGIAEAPLRFRGAGGLPRGRSRGVLYSGA
ncbi:DUF1963 domain-containing protein [Kocuria turfanensis]|uniref:Uncharacterized protein n=1 Tax=Kocuria turfanensis TaxID=388357 RepID=A0A512IH35_9MICC|nr:DUF1963 domain-containing protein [Kocuria turfanensis]GEO97029.1 hypothetical protein KTU01_31520 [Kocuria turfanensis]